MNHAREGAAGVMLEMKDRAGSNGDVMFVYLPCEGFYLYMSF